MWRAAFVLAVGVVLRRLRRRTEPPPQAAPALPADPARLVERLQINYGRTVVAAVSAVAGAALFVGSLHLARDLLKTENPPRGNPSVGYRGPADDVARRGIVVVTHTQVSTCDEPVRVTVTAEGTSEYWQANRGRMPRDGRFTFIVGGGRITHVGAGIGELGDNLNPDLLPLAPHSAANGLKASAVHVRHAGETTYVSAGVADWRDTWKPVYLRFDADWLSPRTDGSCYLALPSLVGPASEAGVEGNATLLAYNSLIVYGGNVDVSLTQPQPDTESQFGMTWRCEERFPLPHLPSLPAVRRGELLDGLVAAHDGRATAFTEHAYRRGTFRSEGCGAVATIAESGASSQRDLRLLLLGGFVGLCLALIAQGVFALLQAAIDMRRDAKALDDLGSTLDG